MSTIQQPFQIVFIFYCLDFAGVFINDNMKIKTLFLNYNTEYNLIN